MTFLITNWRMCLLTTLIALNSLFVALWRHEVRAFDEYRVQVIALGMSAEIETKRVNTLHQSAVKEIRDEHTARLPAIRAGAVANYLAHSATGLRLPAAGGSGLPRDAGSPSVPDGAGKECLPDRALIEGAASDALTVEEWQRWARLNGLRTQ